MVLDFAAAAGAAENSPYNTATPHSPFRCLPLRTYAGAWKDRVALYGIISNASPTRRHSLHSERGFRGGVACFARERSLCAARTHAPLSIHTFGRRRTATWLKHQRGAALQQDIRTPSVRHAASSARMLVCSCVPWAPALLSGRVGALPWRPFCLRLTCMPTTTYYSAISPPLPPHAAHTPLRRGLPHR